MKKINFSKIWNIVSTAFVALVVICAIFLVGSRILGYEVYTVVSGSMEPKYSTGDLIYVKSVDPGSVKEGDVITFVVNGDLVIATHRVVRIDAEKQHFYTKGDANDLEDASPVHFNNLRGIPKFSIPLLGYVSNFIQNPPGMYIAVAVIILLMAAVFLPDLIKKKEAPAESEQSETLEKTETAEISETSESIEGQESREEHKE